jgi:hypothetical protein
MLNILCKILLLLVLLHLPAAAQHNHPAGRNEYHNWASGVTQNCCNNQDCGDLNEADVKETARGTEIKIADQWCPVLFKHYITKGKSPDWNKAHACIRRSYSEEGYVRNLARVLESEYAPGGAQAHNRASLRGEGMVSPC